MLILNVIYLIVAVAMVVLILMQRGAGATAGSGFGGGGASGTVFGSRGSSNFLSKSTKYLAIIFMSISLFMAWNVKRGTSQPNAAPASDLGVMGSVPTAPSTTPATTPAANQATPAATPAAPAKQSVPATNANPQPEQPVKN